MGIGVSLILAAAGAVLIAVLSLFEIVNYPTWQKNRIGEWLVDTGVLLVALGAVGLSVYCLVARRRAVAHP